MAQHDANRLAERVYLSIKADIFDFRLLPGDRFTETELAERYRISRTPIRDALYRLRREGYLDVAFRSGWSVKPFDFARFDELYDLRMVLECAAVERLCQRPTIDLPDLATVWLVPAAQREWDPIRLAELDEDFHCALVAAAGNRETVSVHMHITEQIRVVRRLDFCKPPRVAATYEQHAHILHQIERRRSHEAGLLLRAHIEESKAEVRRITLHMLYEARAPMQLPASSDAAPAQPALPAI